jgi:hypothetical protein
MKRIAILLFLLTMPLAAQDTQTAKILAVKTYEHGRIAYWEGRVPIYDGYPFYDITLALGSKKYVVRYNTVSGFLPSRWKVGNEIKVQVQGKKVVSLINGTEDVPVEIVRGVAADCVLASTPPSGPIAGGQVPCD